MKNEAEFKRLIKQSVKAQKGYSQSLAAPMFPGIPDLYVVMPSFIPILLEAKWLGDIPREVFSRTLKFTPMQIEWIAKCHEITPYSAMGIVGFQYNKKIHAALVAYGTELFTTFTHEFITHCSYTICNSETKKLDILSLFANVPIPRISPLTVKGWQDNNGHERDKVTVAA